MRGKSVAQTVRGKILWVVETSSARFAAQIKTATTTSVPNTENLHVATTEVCVILSVEVHSVAQMGKEASDVPAALRSAALMEPHAVHLSHVVRVPLDLGGVAAHQASIVPWVS